MLGRGGQFSPESTKTNEVSKMNPLEIVLVVIAERQWKNGCLTYLAYICESYLKNKGKWILETLGEDSLK